MTDTTKPLIDIGIPEETRIEIASELGRLLADTYTLYLKTHNYHWNVTGPMFNTLHLMFEEQYNELWLAIDLIAERIRSLREAPRHLRQVRPPSLIGGRRHPHAVEMLANLVVATRRSPARRGGVRRRRGGDR